VQNIARTLALLAPLLATGVQAQNIYSCVDAKGAKRTSDRPIPECSDREQRILNKDGTVKRVLPPGAASSASQPQRSKTSDLKRSRLPLATDHRSFAEQVAALPSPLGRDVA